MRITDALHGELSLLLHLVDQVERLRSRWSADQVQAAGALVGSALRHHAAIEEALLFPALEPVLGSRGGPLVLLRNEHRLMEVLLARLAADDDPPTLAGLLGRLTRLAGDHLALEEGLLLPFAGRFLPEPALRDLGARWPAAIPGDRSDLAI